jgi:hypothetical protein
MALIDGYTESVLGPQLQSLRLSPQQREIVIADVTERLESLLMHWHDLRFRRTLLVVGTVLIRLANYCECEPAYDGAAGRGHALTNEASPSARRVSNRFYKSYRFRLRKLRAPPSCNPQCIRRAHAPRRSHRRGARTPRVFYGSFGAPGRASSIRLGIDVSALPVRAGNGT